MSSSKKSSKKAPDDRRKKMIYTGVIAACLATGALAYYLQVHTEPKPTPEVKQAAQKQEEIQKSMEAQQPKAPPTSPAAGGDFERKVTRGTTAVPSK